MVERDGIQVHFAKADGDEIKTNAQLRKISFDACIWVTEIDALYEELQEKGVDIVEGVVMRIYGSREIVILDCNGFKITFAD
jgi:uncharacterized glyoxalase superfamily protein PhnB